ncbi:MAG: GNAT family N-acetyltransferase [Coriobacteriia bacterium]|nr:GNAT family N-acetyltransferase [Coriobacteriia bacterium]
MRPEWRGRGIGSELLEALLGVADVNHWRVSLSVSRQNPAVRLYNRSGFVESGGDSESMTMVRPCRCAECKCFAENSSPAPGRPARHPASRPILTITQPEE